MYLLYGAVKGNGRAVLQLYQERFPSRRLPNYKIFPKFYRQLYEKGSFIASIDERGRSRTVRRIYLEEILLDHVDETQ
ncbi:hypothetical protein TNCV_3957301 [Trichonephila clavipes]|nr:hypothetical protein TNCV_3957301 [Trichonephila clavipes]